MKVTLKMEIDIDDSKEPENAEVILHENLGNLVQKAQDDGLITVDSKLKVTGCQAWIQVDKNA